MKRLVFVDMSRVAKPLLGSLARSLRFQSAFLNRLRCCTLMACITMLSGCTVGDFNYGSIPIEYIGQDEVITYDNPNEQEQLDSALSWDSKVGVSTILKRGLDPASDMPWQELIGWQELTCCPKVRILRGEYEVQGTSFSGGSPNDPRFPPKPFKLAFEAKSGHQYFLSGGVQWPELLDNSPVPHDVWVEDLTECGKLVAGPRKVHPIQKRHYPSHCPQHQNTSKGIVRHQ